MTKGGLLEKAIESNPELSTVQAEIAPSRNDGLLGEILRNRLSVGIGVAIFGLILSWVLASPRMQSEYPLFGIVPIVVLAGSFYLILDSVNGKMVGAVAVIYLLMASSPYIASSVSTSSITIAETSLSSDSTELTLKIRQSGGILGESLDSADVSVTYDGSETWSETFDFSIDRSDAFGDYGQITVLVSDFYSKNAEDGSEYVITVIAGGSEDDLTLNSIELKRTINDAQIESVGYMGTGSDCSGNTENCVIGVVISSWIGLDASIGNRPGGMQYANYNVSATLKEEGDLAVQYPDIEVINGEATWEDNGGEFGEGKYSVGEYASFLALDGSVSAPEMGDSRMYIPIDDFLSPGDYGCYTLEIVVSQTSPWGGGEPVEESMYYDYNINGDTESWDPVNSC